MKAEIARLLERPEFPRSRGYDPEWVLDNQMGPNALWLTEWLCQALPLEPGMRVLDLGCGRALSSVFLARELGVRVWATDLWMSPDHNWERAVAAGVGDRVCPVKAEAHALPFAAGFFDAVVCIDAYHYFGTDEPLPGLPLGLRPAGRAAGGGRPRPGSGAPRGAGAPEGAPGQRPSLLGGRVPGLQDRRLLAGAMEPLREGV
ncbi:MAG: methyltransferase domain-containing protein [Myxococcales bacterium]